MDKANKEYKHDENMNKEIENLKGNKEILELESTTNEKFT